MDFSIKAFFGGDTTQLQAAVGEAEGIIGNFSKQAKTLMGDVGASFLGAFSVFTVAQKLIGEVGEIQAHIKELANLAKEYEISGQSIQAWQTVVEKTGGSVEAANLAFARAKLSIDKLIEGNKAATDAFEALGYSARDFVGVPLDEALAKIAVGYENNRDKAGAYAAVAEILGARTIPQLNNALAYLAENGVAGMIAKQTALNRVWDQDAVQALGSFAKAGKDAWAFLETGFVNFAGHIVAAPQLLANSMGVLAGTVANALDGVKSDAELMVNAVLGGIEKVNKAQDNTGKLTAFNAEQAAKAVEKQMVGYEAELKALADSATGHEKIQALLMLRNQLEEDCDSLFLSEKEKLKAITELRQLEVEIAKLQNVEETKLAAEINKRNDAAEKESAALSVRYEKMRFEELPLAQQLTELQTKQNALELTRQNYLKGTDEYMSVSVQLHDNQLQITKTQSEIDKQNLDTLKATVVSEQQRVTLLEEAKNAQFSIAGIQTGQFYDTQSTEVLQEIMRRNTEQIAGMRLEDQQSVGRYNEQYGNIGALQTENETIANIVKLRQTELQIYESRGYTAALAAYPGNPSTFDEFLATAQQTNTQALQTNRTLTQINNILTTALT